MEYCGSQEQPLRGVERWSWLLVGLSLYPSLDTEFQCHLCAVRLPILCTVWGDQEGTRGILRLPHHIGENDGEGGRDGKKWYMGPGQIVK